MKKSKAILSTLFGVLVTGLLALSSLGSVYATVECPIGSIKCPDATATCEANSYAECNLPNPDPDDKGFAGDLTNIINWIVGVAGLVAVVVVIIGGVTYMTSNGDPGKVKKGKDTILYGIIGLLICALAFAIVNFIVGGLFTK